MTALRKSFLTKMKITNKLKVFIISVCVRAITEAISKSSPSAYGPARYNYLNVTEISVMMIQNLS